MQEAESSDEDMPSMADSACCRPLTSVLEMISIGAYNTKLYFNKRNNYSSWVGGLVTLIIGYFLALIVWSVLADPVRRKELVVTTIPIDQSEIA